MLTNYHTHHYRCKHAEGTIEDYIIEAIKQGYAEIGISCHIPFDESFPEVGTGQRMDFADLPTYFAEIDALKVKYQAQIKVLKSLEAEYFSQIHDYVAVLAEETDYLLLAGHFIELDGKYPTAFNFTKVAELHAYAEQLEIAMATGMFQILAHPDLFMVAYPKWDAVCEEITHKIAQAVLKYDVILEVNANGLRRRNQPYPAREFWDIIATHYPQTKVIVNADCHAPRLLNDEMMHEARRLAKDLDLNVLVKLP